MCFIRRWFVVAGIILVTVSASSAEEPEDQYDPNRYGIMISASDTTMMDEDIDLYRLSAFASFDYDKIWRHWAPRNLRWKLEFTAGMTTSPFERGIASFVMIAQYYFPDEGWTQFKIRPFLEGGVGLAYADFQVEGQGSRWMGNPQIGVGTDFTILNADMFVSVRLYDHFSNAGLNEENRGLNFVTAYLGYYF